MQTRQRLNAIARTDKHVSVCAFARLHPFNQFVVNKVAALGSLRMDEATRCVRARVQKVSIGVKMLHGWCAYFLAHLGLLQRLAQSLDLGQQNVGVGKGLNTFVNANLNGDDLLGDEPPTCMLCVLNQQRGMNEA